MKKKELLSAIAKETGSTAKLVQEVLSNFQKVLLDCLKSDKEVPFLEIGKFKIAKRSARTGINPKTKEKINIPAKEVPQFVSSRKFKSFAEGSSKSDDFTF